MKMNPCKPKFLSLPTGGKIAYHCHTLSSSSSSKCGVLFLNGFRSNMNGNKALKLQEFCLQSNIGYTRFDYRGHGESSGNFDLLGLSDWIEDSRAILQHYCQQQQARSQILVGSSMGVWIALRLALENPQQVSGILGIAAAPDFTQDLWNNFTEDQREELEQNGRILLPSEYSTEPYPISKCLLEDSQQWLLLVDKNRDGNPRIDIHCPVRLIHGHQDRDISWKKSLQLVDSLASKDIQLTLIKSGDHRLSTPKNLDTICQTLSELLTTVGPP